MRRSRDRFGVVTLATVMLVTQAAVPAAGQSPSPVSGSPAPSGATQGVSFPAAPSMVVSPDSQLPADAATSVPDLPASEAVDLGATWRRSQAIVGQLPDQDWLTTSLADHLEDDPLAAFAWVRDHIGFDAYAGELRGPAGTLTARAGDSLDRALLLQRLLARMVVPTRIVHGTLDDATAAKVLARSFQRPASPLASVPIDEHETGSLSTLVTRARHDYAELRQALGDRVSTMDGTSDSQALADIRDHAWLQMQYGATWLDLDPTLPDSQPGQALTTVDGVLPDIPAELQHAVTVRVLVETLDGGKLSESTALEQRLVAADAAATETYLGFAPASDSLGTSIATALGSSVNWKPTLFVGGQDTDGTPFPIAPGSDLFSGDAQSGPQVSRLRLEVAVDGPDGTHQVYDRDLLDRLPAAARASGNLDASELVALDRNQGIPVALSGLWHIQVSTGGFDQRAHQLLRGAAARLARLAMSDPSAAQAYGFPTSVLPTTVGDETMVLDSEEAIRRGLDAEPGFRAYVAHPRVFVHSMVPTSDQGGIMLQTDLMVDGVRIITDGSRTPAEAAARQMWYGSLESASETQQMLRRVSALFQDPATPVGTSQAMGQPLRVLAPADAASLGTVVSPTLTTDLQAGSLVVVPGDPATANVWWTVDPATGVTRAVVAPNLGGQAVVGGAIAPTTPLGTTPERLFYQGPYVNASSGGPRIFAPGIDDPLPTEAEMQQLFREAEASIEAQRPPPPQGGCGGSEYGTTLCVVIIGAVAFVVLGVGIYIYMSFF